MKRHLDEQLAKHFAKQRLVPILLGSRQVGKTTIVKKIFPKADYYSVDNELTKSILEAYDIESYKTLIKQDAKEIILDEVHLLSNPGRAVKILYDQMEQLRIVITGSSSLHIKNKTGESLAGRKIDIHMYPLTFSEYLNQKGIEEELNYNILQNALGRREKRGKEGVYRFDLTGVLENVLIYGLYPYLINHSNARTYLLNFVDSLIFKDILELQLIDNRKTAGDLLRLLAYQTGNLVNYSELADSLKTSQQTVKRYIEIFEQSFILFRLYPYAKKKRNEITKAPKIYFYDTGVRNALIGDFSGLAARDDKGALFENFIISELIKQNSYIDNQYNFYYWRTKQGSEMDVIIEKDKELFAVELKYRKGVINKAFKNHYPEAKVKLLTAENFY